MPRHRTAACLAAYLTALLLAVTPAAAQPGDRFEPPADREIDNAIGFGLDWLIENQITEGPDAGSWPGLHFRRAGASFAGLALLANGHRPDDSREGQVLQRAIKFVMAGMDPRGYVGEQYESGMYVHGAATLFGLSYLGRSQDPTALPELAAWCRRAVDCILEAQQIRKASHAAGGWRFTPETIESDVSVTVAMLQVLHAARQNGFDIPPRAFDQAMAYINRAYQPAGEHGAAGFLYRPGVSLSPELAITGAALYIKRVLERRPDTLSQRALPLIADHVPTWSGRPYMGYFFIGNFYLCQGLFQVGGEPWDHYRPRLARLLIDRQAPDGHWSLPPDNARQTKAAGHVYPTAMAVLMLSLDKQYLPVYQRQKQLF